MRIDTVLGLPSPKPGSAFVVLEERPLDDYLHRRAVQHVLKGIATVQVLVDDAAPVSR